MAEILTTESGNRYQMEIPELKKKKKKSWNLKPKFPNSVASGSVHQRERESNSHVYEPSFERDP